MQPRTYLNVQGARPAVSARTGASRMMSPAGRLRREDRPEVRALLHELNALDKELYEYGVALHEEQLRACECCEAGAAVRLS